MELLRFVFSAFWVFIGVAILICVTGDALAAVIHAARSKKESEG